jgi:hypothetical protein
MPVHHRPLAGPYRTRRKRTSSFSKDTE